MVSIAAVILFLKVFVVCIPSFSFCFVTGDCQSFRIRVKNFFQNLNPFAQQNDVGHDRFV